MARPRRSEPVDFAAELVADLEALRLQAGLTDDELADRAGYTRWTLGNLRGGWRLPRLRTIAEFAEVFGYELRLVGKGTGKLVDRKRKTPFRTRAMSVKSK